MSVADLAYFTANGVVFFALPLYVVGPVGSDAAGAGIAFGAFGVTALVCRPFAGRLTDAHLGRRPLLVGGALQCAIGLALLPHAQTVAVVVALRLLQGVAEAAFFVASFATLLDLAPPARVGEALSYNSLGLYLGLALGPPLGELLLQRWGYPTAWYGAAGLAVVAALVVVGIGETRSGTDPAGGRRRADLSPRGADRGRFPRLARRGRRVPRLRVAALGGCRPGRRQPGAARVRRGGRRLPAAVREGSRPPPPRFRSARPRWW